MPFYLLKNFPLLLILIGIALRFSNYIYNRSLWTDEAWMALDVSARTLKEIFFNDLSRVSLPAISPRGLLTFIEKISINTFGNNELALRLFPFFMRHISGSVLYWILLKKWTERSNNHCDGFKFFCFDRVSH